VLSQFAVSFLGKGKIYELQNAANLIQSEDTVVGSYCSDGLENTIIAKEGLTTGITEFAKGRNLPSLMCKGTNLDQWTNSAKFVPKKKIKRNLSSQPTIKSFFEQPGSKTVNVSTSTLVTPAETLDLTNQTCVSNDDSLPENMQCTTSAAKDQDNTNVSSCSLSTDKSNAAALEWQRIQQKMKMTLPRCKGHSEPCIPRSVKKGPNIGRLFYVCARAQVHMYSQFPA
jgi:AP endonuclease-2